MATTGWFPFCCDCCDCCVDTRDDTCKTCSELPAEYRGRACCDCVIDTRTNQCVERADVPIEYRGGCCDDCTPPPPCYCDCLYGDTELPRLPNGECPPCDSSVIGCDDEHECPNGDCPNEQCLCQEGCNPTACWDGSTAQPPFCECPPHPCAICIGGAQPHSVTVSIPGAARSPLATCDHPNHGILGAGACGCEGQAVGDDNRPCTEGATRTLWLAECYKEIVTADQHGQCGPFSVTRQLVPLEPWETFDCLSGRCLDYSFTHAPANMFMPLCSASGGTCGIVCQSPPLKNNCETFDFQVPILTQFSGNWLNASTVAAGIQRSLVGGVMKCRWTVSFHSGVCNDEPGGSGIAGVSDWFDADPLTGLCDCSQPHAIHFPSYAQICEDLFSVGGCVGCCWKGGPATLTPG